jgi:hypothetical protein
LIRSCALGKPLAIKIGDTFYVKDGGHLLVVISDPSARAGEFITVNLTTDWFRAGRECELSVGEHPWVREPSYISFGDARKWGPKEEIALAQQIALQTMRMHSPMKPSILAKIIAAGKKSKALRSDYKKCL